MHNPIIFVLALMSTQLHSSQDFDRDQLEKRIRPVGQVHVEKTAVATPVAESTTAPAAEEAKKSPGQATYEQYCIICHRDGVAGAPKFHDKDAWGSRVNSKKVDGLVASALKGLNAMPPKGTCQSCTDSDLKAAIEYMLPPS